MFVIDASSDDAYDSVSNLTLSATNTDDDSPETDCTLQSNWNLSECGCPSGQTRTSSSSGTCATTLGAVSLSTVPSCSSVTIQWSVGTTANLQSLSLASKAPGGGWIVHSTHLPDARSFSIDNLVNGQHSFQVLAVYANGTSETSNVGNVAVDDCIPPPETTTTTTPTTPPPPP